MSHRGGGVRFLDDMRHSGHIETALRPPFRQYFQRFSIVARRLENRQPGPQTMSHERAASGRILIVDDEPELVEGFRSVLEGAGFEATIQTSLITLPLTIRKLNPDLILVDLSMPG